MSDAVIKRGEYSRYAADEGVFVKYFFRGKDDNVPITTFEIIIMPGFTLSPHTHDDAIGYFHVISGECELWHDGAWKPLRKGEASYAPVNVEHGLRNVGQEILVIFAIMGPPGV